MSKYSINGTTLDNIAAPIMSMRGLTGGLTPEEMGTNANAVLANVTDALAAIAAKGVDITGMNSDNLAALIAALATLPALTTPGAAADLRTGKQLIDGSGNIVTGTMPEQAAQTITPGTTNKVIASGRYLTGAQTVKGDANLIAENIASGKTIFGVAGTFSGGGKVITGEFTFGSGNTHTITHNFGEIPNFAVAITDTPTKTGKGFVIACMVFGGVEYLISNTSSYGSTLLFETNDTDMTSTSSGTFKQATDTTIKYSAGVTGVSGVGIYYAVGVI